MIFEDSTSLVARMAAGSLDAGDFMAATYAQIEHVNPEVNALVSIAPRDDAIVEARRARGPLAGLPIAVKDLANAAGFPTSMGSPIFATRGPMETDDLFVARLRAAGAVVIAKSNTPEFGTGSHTFNPVHGTTRNAWDTRLSAGGSSGGATKALATGMVSLADGSDMMGSLRNPAGWSNTYGLRPTWGLVPSEPRQDTFLHQLATIGPMARSPSDVELMLRVMAGPDLRQPHGRSVQEASQAPRRLGWLGNWDGAYPTEAGILELCEASFPIFESLDCTVEPVAPPFAADRLWDAWVTLRNWQHAVSMVPFWDDPRLKSQLKPEELWEVDRGRKLTAMDIHRASTVRSEWFSTASKLFATYDALLMPTAQVWPFPAENRWPKEIGGQAMDTYHRWMEITVPVNILGIPALSLPAGFSEKGLPMGLQLIGPRDGDLGLLALAKRWHDRAPWVLKRPKIAV